MRKPSALAGFGRLTDPVCTRPALGRPAGGGTALRERVISHGKSGYIALCEYAPAEQPIRVVPIRHQRKAGYRGR